MDDETFYKEVTKRATTILKELLLELELKYGDKEHELDFVADLYSRLVTCVYMGYQPKLLANGAEDAAFLMMKMANEEEDDGTLT
jgi:hypothetical protein